MNKDSAWDSVRWLVGDSVVLSSRRLGRNAVEDSVSESVTDSVGKSVWWSTKGSVEGSIRDSAWLSAKEATNE